MTTQIILNPNQYGLTHHKQQVYLLLGLKIVTVGNSFSKRVSITSLKYLFETVLLAFLFDEDDKFDHFSFHNLHLSESLKDINWNWSSLRKAEVFYKISPSINPFKSVWQTGPFRGIDIIFLFHSPIWYQKT